ncbi:hypothetical protein UAY_03334 [Enterococcus moraviensis ATCC BAA-383]|uniref:Hint domain-containing protein n=1 Tax=Enterococcus moraviensis ATCC BAA-383 TaxID=1158609 RepID=R2QL59_9ENTE|nr:polymorphic toxin-type HINT domain-containing protein [Enterococcus moraviensis]EOH95908.1 hypothetical protein UAY_03334 [Enterococcus moraviensis ATCC BAA-383]EOT66395.1 hypothetical protein I586_02666 [Enterococcus moraviensis ATCC BAA-383]OJG67541.1 hypothetical protein RV09_GL002310 [Enterococcus moraviensis]
MTGEALESANKRLLSDYQSMVCGIDTIEDEILEQIDRFEEVKRDIKQQMSTTKTMRPDLERRYINACEIIEKRQEKLKKFHQYNVHSATIFSDYESCEAEFNAGLNQVANCKAWNPATGTFDMTRLNMSWAKPINERWKARAKELENRAKAKRDNWEKQVKAEGLKLQGELDKRKYMLVDINGTKRWMWVIDPTRITQEDFQVNEAYDLWIKNQIELYGRDAVFGKEEPDYLTRLAIELRDGKNYDTGKPLTDLEKAQRWATIASMIAATGIAGYYANKPLTAGQVTPKSKKASGPKCFVSGTLILTEQGHKPIESIQIGEKVFAKHENSNIQSYEKVVQLFVSDTSRIVRIIVGNEIIETTEEHPFYLINKGWVKAKELACNDNLIDSLGNTLLITDIQIICLNKPIKVYNFEVENAHTYFVSNLSILVHNICDDALNKWHKGTFADSEASLTKHFEKHGAEVKANSLEQYLNKAEDFSRKLKGARTKKIDYPTPNVVRYYKNGKYIDIHKPTGKIISFGKQ